MEGRKIISLISGRPVEVNSNTTIQKGTDNNVLLCKNRCITYTLGRRFLSLNIAQVGYADLVNDVVLNISEKNGKGSSANLDLRIIGDDRYGVLSKISSKFLGSYESSEDHFCVPPLATTEVFRYLCRETGSAGFLSFEKKVINEVVRSVKATHAFIVGDETMNVKIKITYDTKNGLNVEVEEPLRLTTAYMSHFDDKIVGKNNREMDARMRAFYNRLSSPKPKPNGNKPNYNILYKDDERPKPNGNKPNYNILYKDDEMFERFQRLERLPPLQLEPKPYDE